MIVEEQTAKHESPPASKRSLPWDLLLVLPVRLGDEGRGLLFESQACNGIERWLANFDRIQVICPVLEGAAVRAAHSTIWKPVSEIAGIERVKFMTLREATSPVSFARAFRGGRQVIRRAIEESRYLSFAIGGLFGDWGAVACLEARKLGRPYSVWTDRVEHQVCISDARNRPAFRRLKAYVRAALMCQLERRSISGAALGLFHGASCFEQYAPLCETSYLVHDFPMSEADAISSERLSAKCRAMQGAPLSIGYVGRADEMKGPFNWLDVMAGLRDRGIVFEATWLGDGPLLAGMREEVAQRGLADCVSLPGFVSDRGYVLDFLRETHLMVFCHKTPESPRCLVEALVSGCPIIGYASEYVAELIEQGGGSLVELNDTSRLVDRICDLNRDRDKLCRLAEQAVPAGRRINETAGFEYRSDLIKKHLTR